MSTLSTESGSPLITAGRVGRPHGLAGSFHVTRPRSRLLRAAESIEVDGASYKVGHVGGTDTRPVLTLAGVGTRERAEQLRGQELWVDRSVLPPLEEDEWLAEDLVGCSVLSGDTLLGKVERLLAYPSCDLLEVSGDSAPVLIPLISDAVIEVDVEAKRILVDGAFLGLGE